MAEKHTALVIAPGEKRSEISLASVNANDGEHRFGDISVFCAWPSYAEQTARIVQSSDGEKDTSQEPAQTCAVVLSPDSIQANTENALLESDSDIVLVVEDVPLTIWQARRITAVPTEEQGKWTLRKLRSVMQHLITAARNDVAPQGVPLYYILYIGETAKSGITLPWWTRRKQFIEQKGESGGLAGRPALDIQTLKNLLDLLDEVRAETGLALTRENISPIDPDMPTLDAAYYEHYSPARHSRGYLVLDPRCSIVIDCAEDDVLTLFTMLQQARITPQGLTTSGFIAAQTRVNLWDVNSDVQASIDDITQVSRDSATSALGQVLLSFALAGIATLLALTALPGARPGQLVAPMLIYALASILHAFYALVGKRIFFWLGIFCLAFATVLSLVIFLVPSFAIPFFPH